jgi:hypothetical protein
LYLDRDWLIYLLDTGKLMLSNGISYVNKIQPPPTDVRCFPWSAAAVGPSLFHCFRLLLLASAAMRADRNPNISSSIISRAGKTRDLGEKG